MAKDWEELYKKRESEIETYLEDAWKIMGRLHKEIADLKREKADSCLNPNSNHVIIHKQQQEITALKKKNQEQYLMIGDFDRKQDKIIEQASHWKKSFLDQLTREQTEIAELKEHITEVEDSLRYEKKDYEKVANQLIEQRKETKHWINELNESEIKNDELMKVNDRLNYEKKEVEEYAEQQRERVISLDKMLDTQVKTYWELANKYVDLRSTKETVKYVFPEEHVFLKKQVPSKETQERANQLRKELKDMGIVGLD